MEQDKEQRPLGSAKQQASLSAGANLSRHSSLPRDSRFAARFGRSQADQGQQSPTTTGFSPFSLGDEWPRSASMQESDASAPSNDYQKGHRRATSSTQASPTDHTGQQAFFPAEDHLAEGSSLLRRHQSLNLRNSRPRNITTGNTSLARSGGPSVERPALLTTSSDSIRSRSTSSDAYLHDGPQSGGSEGGSGAASPSLASPMDGIMKTPWSPTPDDDAILGGNRRPLSAATQEGLGISGNSRSGNVSPSLEDVNSNFGHLSLKPATLPVPSAKRATPSLAPLITSFDGRPKPGAGEASPVSAQAVGSQISNPRQQGPFSAAAYVRPIGHSFTQQNKADNFVSPVQKADVLNSKGYTAAPGVGDNSWFRQKATIAGYTPSPVGNDSLEEADEQSTVFAPSPPLPTQSLPPAQTLPQPSQQPFPNHFAPPSHSMYSRPDPQPVSDWPIQPQPGYTQGLPPPHSMQARWPSPQPSFQQSQHRFPQPEERLVRNGYSMSQNGFTNTAPPQSIQQQPNVRQVMAQNNYNPVQFDCEPRKARFAVIKSYTEEDVHKSIKFGIWSSTKLGNNRLDRVFKEGTADESPVYLFFSVNGSGHFCGIAEMLTPVDETVDSDVWADSKWKGTFKVRWHFIKDVPNTALRHLRLHNTAEKKPVTSSRDTQEVPFDIGIEMLKTFYGFPSKTTLIQDFNYYNAREAEKRQQVQPPPAQNPQIHPIYQSQHNMPRHVNA